MTFMGKELNIYALLLAEIKQRIWRGQVRANLSANKEMLATYWDIGRMIHERQQQEGWGKGVIPRLARDLKNELADVKGFSERNIGNMLVFYKEYHEVAFLQQVVAKSEIDIRQMSVSQLTTIEIQQLLIPNIGWAQHLILIQKIKDLPTRFWYMQQILLNGWGRDYLLEMIKSHSHKRQGRIVHNFTKTLPEDQSNLAKQMLKDPYIFDFMTFAQPFTEHELELGLIKNVEKFLIELGSGFAFVGRQFKLTVSAREFYLDLLFYHLKMRCFVVIELKKGDFQPEYAGKMNFYCSAVDDQLKHPTDQPTIGLILCQDKDRLFAEYALKDIHKPIGISEYEFTRALPESFKGSLPSIDEIENELFRKKR
jgi:predicted nuclease of restriction endonuclease-like (RecB) superfamily